MEYITIEPKSDDCADPNPIYEGEVTTKEEIRLEYWPFLEGPVIRLIEEVKE